MIPPPASFTPQSLADWLESLVLFLGVARASQVYLRRLLEEQEFAEEAIDQALTDLAARVEWRQRLLGDAYPLTWDGSGYESLRNWDDTLAYSFLLLVSLNQHYATLSFSRGTGAKPAELFEHLCARALQSYVGGSVCRFGHPRRSPMPSSFATAIARLSQLLGEDAGDTTITLPDSKDDGLDLVAWRSFADSRAGQLILIAQCAIGTDWKSKLAELNEGIWRRHIAWPTSPLRCVALPFDHDDGVLWRRSSIIGGVILDRIRVVAQASIAGIDDNLRVSLIEWCTKRIAAVRRL